jgi:hypothetical protein
MKSVQSKNYAAGDFALGDGRALCSGPLGAAAGVRGHAREIFDRS